MEEEKVINGNILHKRIRAGDTDYSGFWFNARVIEWFSSARIEILRSKKITYSSDGHLIVDGQSQKVFLVVGEVYARFLAAAKFDELVQLTTKITEVKDRTIKFEYEVKGLSDEKILATGSSTSICIDKETMRSAKIPSRMVASLRI